VNVSVVIPCYRSRDTLPELVTRLHASLGEVAEQYEILLVVDGSPDDTYAVARQLEIEDSRVTAVLLRRNYGQHHASLAGIERARYEVTVLMDDDLQHRPEEIHLLLDPLRSPLVDVVYGNAVDEEHSLWRNATSQGVKRVMEIMGLHNARLFSSFVAFRTDLRDGFGAVSGSAYIDVLLGWSTNAVIAVPVRMDSREQGRSGYTWRSLVRLAWDMTTGTAQALRFVTVLGYTACLLGLGLLVFVVVSYFSSDVTPVGWASQAAMTALFSGLTMLSLGVIGNYVGRLYMSAQNRPTYVVRLQGRPGRHVGLPSAVPVAESSEEERDALADAQRRHQAQRS
jgi:glycosyltransferase involved in cell wall biosynthesis